MTYPKRAETEHSENGPLVEQNYVLLCPWSLALYMGPLGFPVKLTVYIFLRASLDADTEISARDNYRNKGKPGNMRIRAALGGSLD